MGRRIAESEMEIRNRRSERNRISKLLRLRKVPHLLSPISNSDFAILLGGWVERWSLARQGIILWP